jgi:multidrug resistance efflux pump
VPVTPEIAGRILEWQVREGDRVTAGDIIGRQDLGTSLTSAAINPTSMANLGGVLAEKAQFKAPISGQVIQSTAQVGQMVSPGVTLAVIADTDSLYVSSNIKEGEIGLVKLGQEVLVKVDAFPDRTFRGQVENIGRATVATFSLLGGGSSSGNFTKVTQVIPVKIHLFDTGGTGLMVGMNATIRISILSVK